MRRQKGFTLVEVIIVAAIIVLIVVMSIASYRYFEKRTELEATAQKIVAVLKLAQTKTLASEDASQYGVRLESNRYIFFKGGTYQGGAPDNKIYLLPSRLEISNISLTGGGSDVVFQRINGQTDQDGTIDLRIISQPTELETVNIHASGQIELASSLSECCDTNRLADGRHIHLDMGWSIQGATTLTLYFPDTPTVNINVTMAGYFNPGQTEFDWSDTIDVNGQDQELRIHTHFLDAVETDLCVHRNGDVNNKPLEISIDSKDLVSFTAGGQPTVDTWGGTMEIQ